MTDTEGQNQNLKAFFSKAMKPEMLLFAFIGQKTTISHIDLKLLPKGFKMPKGSKIEKVLCDITTLKCSVT